MYFVQAKVKWNTELLIQTLHQPAPCYHSEIQTITNVWFILAQSVGGTRQDLHPQKTVIKVFNCRPSHTHVPALPGSATRATIPEAVLLNWGPDRERLLPPEARLKGQRSISSSDAPTPARGYTDHEKCGRDSTTEATNIQPHGRRNLGAHSERAQNNHPNVDKRYGWIKSAWTK